MKLYLDTSVLVAGYIPETISGRVQALLSTCEPVISFLTEVEFCSAVAKRMRLGEISETGANNVITLFNAHLEEEIFQVIALTARHYHFARECLSRLKTSLRTLDALHLAIASKEKLTLVTADGNLVKAAKYFRVACQTVTGVML